MDLVGIPLSIIPVCVFLVALIFLDSYKLVAMRVVLRTLTIGCLVAGACFFLNDWLRDVLDVGKLNFQRYIAPVVEELLKSLYLVYLIRAGRVGFMVDAAIRGFAIGAGFGLIENIYYLQLEQLGDASVLLWIVRGFGTAVMHGSTMATLGILLKGVLDRPALSWFASFLGLALAIVIHSLWNHFLLHPLAATAVVLIVMPLFVVLAFEHSERVTRDWIGTGLDTDVEILESITSGEVRETRVGEYLRSLRDKFPGIVLADMLCLLRIQLELSVRGKAMLIARQAGVEVPLGPDVEENLAEMKYLEKTVGKTGKLAMEPLLHTSSRDLWQLYMLGK